MAKTMGVVTLSDEYRSLMDGREKYEWDMKGSYETGKDEQELKNYLKDQ